MNKKIIAIITVMALMLIMAVPAMAGNGDNTGDDNMPCSVGITNASLVGDYTLGSEKIFKISTYASTSVGSIVNRKIEITGDAQVSKFEFLDGDTWKSISEYNTQISLANDVDRQIKVVFDTAGKYTIRFSLINTKGVEAAYSERVISVTDTQIALYVEPDTTAEPETTEAGPITTEPDTTDAPETTVSAEPTTKEVVTTTKKVKIPKAKIKTAKKKKAAKKVRITLKKFKNVTGYQVQISRTKKFKAKKVITKYTKKVKFTVKKLKPGKKYYVRARAYAKVNNKKVYGKWSKKKKIKFTK